MSYSPAFQIYPNDWLGSTKIILMEPEEEGAYIRLLMIEWNEPDCGLPNDDRILSRLSRLGDRWFGESSEKIRSCFFEKNGRLFNARLLKERQKQERIREARSNAGKKSGEVRLNSSELQIAWSEFEEMRKQKRKPITEIGRDRLLKKLERLSNGDDKIKIEIINQSLDNEWQGFFPLKQQNRTNNQLPSNPYLSNAHVTKN